MKITFLGAVRTVTGSRHLLQVGRNRILLDCGLFQGRREESDARNRTFQFKPEEISAVLLSHAHIDHSGNLPNLVKQGYRGPIHATEATADLCAVMLRDSAHIQLKDAEFINKHPRRRGGKTREPLYTMDDADESIRLMTGHRYDATVQVCEGVTATFRDAGHILGSAIIDLEMMERGVRRRLVFTGDLGRNHLPILRDPAIIPACDVLLTESTYGNRSHLPVESIADGLAEVIARVRGRGGKILIPAFAVGRVQEIAWILKGLLADGRIAPIPIVVDSPLASAATDVFVRHTECYDSETRAILEKDGDPFGFRLIRYIEDVEESKALNAQPGPMIIISPSGMCEAGRILHHLRNNVEDPRNLILIVGFQAEDTLGKRLVERREKVRIFGEEFERRAEVVVMNGFSAHADRSELLGWAEMIAQRPRRTFVIHGNEDQSTSLAEALRERGFGGVEVPVVGQVSDL